jgi:site-specific DNA-methyltransferase (adenine-specific)
MINTIYNCDCVEGMKQLADNSIDLTITSPPYDNLRTYNGFSWDFEATAKELYRVTKQGGVVVWIVNDATIKGSETGTSFKQALYFKEIGFNLHDTMIWKKDSINFPDNTRYGQNFEYMFVLSKGGLKTIHKICDRKNKWAGTKVHGTSRNPDGTTFRKCNHNKSYVKEFGERFNVWQISGEKRNKTGHPAVFPEQLAQDHILSWSNEGDIVLDPFMGSGTTAVASVKNNRKYIGFELSKEYCKIAEQRLKEITAQGTLF